MTESNVPAIREDQSREITRTDTDSWVQVMRPVIALAEKIAGTEFVPKNLRNNIPATTAAILYGREVGLPPMTTLTQTHVIEGKPAMSAEAMRAMVFAAGHQLVVDQTTGAQCTMRGRRAGTEEWTSITWTIDMARSAGVASKQVWKSYPRQMLQARATTELVRLLFPDVIHGFRSTEELDYLDGVVVEDGTAAAAPGEGTTKVARKRAAAKPKTTPPPAALPVGDMDGPPLPGEDGYDDPSPVPPVDQSTAGGEAATAPGGAVGEDVEPPAVDDQPEQVEDVVDADVVEEDPPTDIGNAPEVDTAPTPGPSSRSQHRMLFARFNSFDIESDGERLAYTSALVGREVESFTKMSKAEAHQLIETLAHVKDRATLDALVDAAEERRS